MDVDAPTSGSGDASSSDPIDRIEKFLAVQDGDSSGDDGAGQDPDTSTANPTDKPSGDVEGEAQEPQFTTDHLAQFLGVDPSLVGVDDEGQPVFKTKIDGKESTAKFQDFLKDHQLKGHAENRVREAAAKEQAAERKLQEADQQIAQRFQHAESQMQQLGQLTVIAQQELQHDYNQVNWNELWQSDPGRAGLLEKQFQARNARIQGTLQDVGQRQMQARQQAEQAQKANEEKGKERQVQRLFELIPEWRDSDVLAKERAEMGAWVQKTGVDISDLDLTKASQVRLLRQAWQHETLQASKPAIEQRLREAPKLIKPGAAKQADAGDKSALLKNLKQQARGTGSNSTKAAAAWLVAQGLA